MPQDETRNNQPSGLALASLLFAILATATLFAAMVAAGMAGLSATAFGGASVAAAIIGLILGYVSRRRPPGKAGFVLSLLVLLVGAFWWLF